MTQPFILVPLHTYHKQLDLNKKHLDASNVENTHDIMEKEEDKKIICLKHLIHSMLQL